MLPPPHYTPLTINNACPAAWVFRDVRFVVRIQVNGIFLFNITGGPGGDKASWTVDAKTPGGSVSAGAGAKPDCTLTISDADFVAMATGKLTGMAAFMGGKLKISGNMALAQKFSALAETKKSKL